MTVTIAPGATAEATLSNTVTLLPGALNVTKAITGDGAGLQGDIVLQIDCGTAFNEPFVIPAGTPAGQTSRTVEDLPAGTSCTVTETSSGATQEVAVTPGPPVTVTIEPGATVDAALSNTVVLLAGGLNVTKAITGDGAGLQGEIVLQIDCGTAFNEPFVIPAGTPAGETSREVTGLPAGTSCTVTETSSGSTQQVTVTPGTPVTVTIAPGATVEAALSNTVSKLAGGLKVTKLITGDAAGAQGEIVLRIRCDTGLDESFAIPALSAAGTYVRSFGDLPAGSACTVTEPSTGATQGVAVRTGEPVTVTVGPGEVVGAHITNTVGLVQVQPMTGKGPAVLAYTGASPAPLLGLGAGTLGTGLLLGLALRRGKREAE